MSEGYSFLNASELKLGDNVMTSDDPVRYNRVVKIFHHEETDTYDIGFGGVSAPHASRNVPSFQSFRVQTPQE